MDDVVADMAGVDDRVLLAVELAVRKEEALTELVVVTLALLVSAPVLLELGLALSEADALIVADAKKLTDMLVLPLLVKV